MKMNTYRKQETAIKIAFISLVLLLSGSLLTPGSAVSEDCRINLPLNIQSSGENLNLCIAACNMGDAQEHCHAQCSQPADMNNFVLAVSGGFHPNSYGLTDLHGKTFDRMICTKGGLISLFSKKAGISPSLFLMTQSFII